MTFLDVSQFPLSFSVLSPRNFLGPQPFLDVDACRSPLFEALLATGTLHQSIAPSDMSCRALFFSILEKVGLVSGFEDLGCRSSFAGAPAWLSSLR